MAGDCFYLPVIATFTTFLAGVVLAFFYLVSHYFLSLFSSSV